MPLLPEFDPNDPSVEPDHRWGSYSQTRTRDKGFKTHSDFAKMRAAIDHCRAIMCYEKVNGVWVKIYEHTWMHDGVHLVGDGEACYFCGVRFGPHGGWWYWSGDHPFDKRKLCFKSSCKRANGVYRVPDEPLDTDLYALYDN